jgi:hypothetical protein
MASDKKNDKGTTSPTTAPSTTPTPASFSPSRLPTQVPKSRTPTKAPSIPLVESPSPVVKTTVSSAPSWSIPLVTVLLPEMEIGFKVIGSQVNAQVLEIDIATFLRKTILSNANILGNMTSVDVDVKASPRYSNRRLQEMEMVAEISGFAYFVGDWYPSTKRLGKVLEAYFANWGTGDLVDFLTHDAVLDVTNMEVFVAGILVPNFNAKNSTSDSANLQPKSETNGSLNAGLIAGLVIGCFVFVVSLVVVLRTRTVANKEERLVATPMSSPSRSRGGYGSPQGDLDADFFPVDTPSLSGISLDDSLLTSSTPESTERRPQQYDPKRLDRVITNALQFVEKHQDEKGENDEHPLPDDEGSACNEHPSPEKATHVEMPP